VKAMLHAVLILAAALVVAGCPKKDEVVVRTGEGKELGEVAIDSDPPALLPGGFVALAYGDAKKIFASPFGLKILKMLKQRAPIPTSAGFEPERDIDRAWVGTYSMQGIDVVAVVSGRFDPKRIEQAAASQPQTPLGGAVVVSEYAGRRLYTVQNIGFVVLTPRTVLVGTETAMRRALDRIKEGRVRRQIPDWLDALLKTPNAPIVVGSDLRRNPVPEAVRAQLPFVEKLETIRLVANFEAPGLNVAGTLGYEDEQAAQTGVAALNDLYRNLDRYGWILALLQIPQPLKRLDARAEANEGKLVAELDGQAITVLLDRLDSFLGDSLGSSTIDATTTAPVAP
jgi:hypothetical protein